MSIEESELCSAFNTSCGAYRELAWVCVPPGSIHTDSSLSSLHGTSAMSGSLQLVGPQKDGILLCSWLFAAEWLIWFTPKVQTGIYAKQAARRQNSFWARVGHGMMGRKRGK